MNPMGLRGDRSIIMSHELAEWLEWVLDHAAPPSNAELAPRWNSQRDAFVAMLRSKLRP